MNEGLFRNLTPSEAAAMRRWARENYKPLSEIQGIWHPEVQSECVKMNAEAGAKFDAFAVAKEILGIGQKGN